MGILQINYRRIQPRQNHNIQGTELYTKISTEYAFALMLVMAALLRLIFGKTLGYEVFNCTITLLAGFPYMVFILLLIGAIGIYKRVYDKR